jgi:hypothetical protein
LKRFLHLSLKQIFRRRCFAPADRERNAEEEPRYQLPMGTFTSAVKQDGETA